VIESCSKQTLADFLQIYFFTPLQMHDTGLASSLQVIPQMAKGYAPHRSGVELANDPPFTSLFAAGGIYSTGEDIAKWLTALHSGRVLKPASYAEMTQADSDGYGYGLRASQQSGQIDVGHNGRVPGFASETDYFPATKTGIVLLSNQLSGGVSPGEAAIETDLMHLATEKDAAIRSLGTRREISSEQITRYAGTYSSGKPDIPLVDVAWKDGLLMLTPKGKNKSTLISRSDHEFYAREAEMEVEFVPDPKGSWAMNVFTLPNGTMLTLKRISTDRQLLQ
jgi:CubicO group peptidase (beta-lactamase class C family)